MALIPLQNRQRSVPFSVANQPILIVPDTSVVVELGIAIHASQKLPVRYSYPFSKIIRFAHTGYGMSAQRYNKAEVFGLRL